MSKLSDVLRQATDGMLLFHCLGCDMAHGIKTGQGDGPRWGWNNDVNKPTFTPSILVKYDTLSEASRAKQDVFYKAHGRYPTNEELPYDLHHVCHSFVTDGRIQYLSDCTHAFAGQTIDLPAWDWDNI